MAAPPPGLLGHVTADVVCLASFNADLVAHVPRPIARGETLSASAFATRPGGKGSNAAVAAARQGARVALVARIGDDAYGRMAEDLWRAEGIATGHVEVAAGEATGVAQILVYADGDNSIAVYAGANAWLAERHAHGARAALVGCRVAIASCEVPIAATLAAFRIAREAGAVTVLNPAPAQALPDTLLEVVDVLTPNESELPVVAGLPPGTPVDVAAEALLARGVHAVLVTLGAAGCALHRRGAAVHRLPGRYMPVVDTVGAGDTFNGALAAALARGNPLPEALRWANAAAALSVTGPGAIGAMPSLQAVAALLAEDEARARE
ncbi:MAG: ribokinase [Casimicrobiaceae bacterium]